MYPPVLPRMVRTCLVLLILVSLTATVAALTDKEQLGKELFFDTALSSPIGQSCAACHAPEVGWTGPDSPINACGAVYEGAVPGRFGNRKPPSAAYAGFSPILYRDDTTWTGGMFWDGRATGWTLGDPLAEQALGPFLNPLEQNLPSAQAVVNIVKASPYADLFEDVWGPGSLDDTNGAYDAIGRSIAAYERSGEVNPFSSRYDAYLAGKATLTPQELQGLDLFENEAGCSACHVSGVGSAFTDFTYDNLGVPRNPFNPFYDEPAWNPLEDAWVDTGIGGFLQAAGYPDTVYDPAWGMQKVPTLRNVDMKPSADFIKAYAHNGYFKSLAEIVHFYNTRDTLPQCSEPLEPGESPGVNCWPAPEVAENVNTEELGDLGLTANEEAALVAYLKTLTDVSWINVIKFYDANANGVKDTGETEISGWKYTVGGTNYLTPLDAGVTPGTYTVTEKMPKQTSWKSTTATNAVVTLDAVGQEEDVEFGNLCLGGGGGQSIGYWTNKNGEKLVGSDDLALLRGLRLRDTGGNDFDPSTYGSFKAWLLRADATNMAYMLSAQLAAMELNVLNGKVSGSALIYAPGTTSANALGYATVDAIMAEANAALGADGMTLAGDANRAYQEALKNALDRANNNMNFVQPKPCAFSFA